MARRKRSLKTICRIESSESATKVCQEALKALDELPETGSADVELELKKLIGEGTFELVRPGVYRRVSGGGPERER